MSVHRSSLRTLLPYLHAVCAVSLLAVPIARAQGGTSPPGTRPPVEALENPAVPPGARPQTGPAGELARSFYGKPHKLDYRIILTGFKDNYFISGFTKDAQVKFQFSIKLDLWPNHTRHSIYFGYTQKSLWNLYNDSSPFLDSNYNPEVFYGYFKRYGDIPWRQGKVTGFLDSARVGIEYESNGRDGVASRGWNRVYAYLEGGTYFGTDHYATVALKAWPKPWDIEDNPDITSYRGYGEGTAVYGYDPASPKWWGGGHIGVTYFLGSSRDLARHGIEGFVQWRPAYGHRASWWRFTPNFFAQIFSGYGEYLLDYNVQHTVFRIGVSLEDRVYWGGA